MRWPFNYPGDENVTNVFSQVIILENNIDINNEIDGIEEEVDPE